MLVPVEDDVADDEVEEEVLLDVSEDDDEVDVAVAEAAVLSSVLVVVLSARATMSRLLRACSDLRRSSPSSSGCESPPFSHCSVIHRAFSASSVVQPAASRHVARSSTSTVSMAMHRVIIELSAHDRSDTMFARHSLPINREGTAVAGVARSRATATWARFSRILKEVIVWLWCSWFRYLSERKGKTGRIGLRDIGQLGREIVATLVALLAKQTSDDEANRKL